MAGKFNEIELTWIKDMLDVHGEYMVDLCIAAIESKRLRLSGELADSVNYQTSMQGNNPKLSVNFLSYGRAIEINYFKKSRNTQKWANPNTNQIVWGVRSRTKNTRKKDTRWYARTVYGSLNRLIGTIMYEFSDQELERIKGILDFQKKIAI